MELNKSAARIDSTHGGVVTARHGMVATSQPLAVQCGLDVLERGGNAADAAIAASAMIGLTEPMSCGIGGDMFVQYWDSATQQLYGLNGSGRSPFALDRAVFAKLGLAEIPETGPQSWSVPGCVSGWDELRRKFGSWSLGSLLAPAIEAAERGFTVTKKIGLAWKVVEDELKKWPDSAATFLPNGRAPNFGETFHNPRLAASLRLIADEGPDAFYNGKLAEKIVEFSRANGGYFERRDFEAHESTWVEPVSTTYRGWEIFQLPPNTQAIAVLQMLNLLEPYDLQSLGAGSAEYLHLLIEAKKLAFADRAKYYADPQFAPAPVNELISKAYADERRKLINPNAASTNCPLGDPRLARADRQGDTIYLSVVDERRNCCSFIQSNYTNFGSFVAPGPLGFCLQNRGTLFALNPNHANCLEPYKRPFHTICPGMALENGRPVFCFGVMGGDMQPQGHVQVLVNLLDFGMDVQQASDAPRVRHDGSAAPTGQPAAAHGGDVFFETGISDVAVEQLRAKGHQIKRDAAAGFGGYQGIRIDWENNLLIGGSDHRKDGCALGH
jgi:gamma-glutamyltranspeptidase / glutathione hydrolase